MNTAKNRLNICFVLGLVVVTSHAVTTETSKQDKPNVIFILADNMGISDVQCLGGATSKIATPSMDQIASEGMVFSDAHSSSAVCTPTRYSIITGRYNWRSRIKGGVLGGISKALIEPHSPTVACFVADNGYATACIGKWHIGMDMPTTDGKDTFIRTEKSDIGKPLAPGATNIDWNGVIRNGPTTIGFGHFYGIAASLDMAPYIWINDDKFVGEYSVIKLFERPGPAHEDFEAVDVLGETTRKSIEFIQANKENPMFLYVSFTSPHTPIVPSKEWQGKSGIGAYGDFVMEMDQSIGEIVKALDDAGLAENTLIIVTADNGTSPAARGEMKALVFNGAKPESVQPDKHYPSGIYRSHKADIFEGGHRVPFIARWKGIVEAGTTCEETICLVDIYATCADLLGKTLSDVEAPDSRSFLPHLLGTAKGPLRKATVHHSKNSMFAIRKGKWKLCLGPGSDGWSAPDDKAAIAANFPPVQLYDLSKEPGETINRQDKHPEVVPEMKTLLTRYIRDGRSTPGAKQANDGPERWRQIDWME